LWGGWELKWKFRVNIVTEIETGKESVIDPAGTLDRLAAEERPN
jgi:hypothetical protein